MRASQKGMVVKKGAWVVVVAVGILTEACATVQPPSATGNAAMTTRGAAERKPDLAKLPVARYALLVGVSAYPHESGWTALAGPPNDVEIVARVLKANAGFEDKNVRVLSDLQPDIRDRPTRLNVLKAFSDLARRAAADNGLLMFYFAGHGEQRNGRSYLVPSDGDIDVPAQSIDVEADLRNEIERTDVQQAIMFIDACRSEGPRDKRGAQLMTKEFTKGFDFPRRAVAVVFASSSGQASWESPQNGYFGRALADGLAGEAADDDGRITLGTLIAYVQREVPLLVRRERGEIQEPESVVKGFRADSLVLSWGHRPMGFVRVGFSSAIPADVNVQVFVDERIVPRENWESVRVALGEHDVRGEASGGPP
ncbi:MAG TPA: caspase family protein, partial [Solirubrobacteraceae bacterium]